MNTVCLVGKLTRAPSVRFEGEGAQACTFTLAVQESGRGERTFTLYVPCTSWGKSAEACALLNAEDLVSVQGKLTWQKRQGKCGVEHSVLCVFIREIAVLEAAEAVEVPA